LISRRSIVGIALATGLMLAGGAGLAAADGTPTVTPAPTALPSKADCAALQKSGAAPAIIKTTSVNGVPITFQCVLVPAAVRGVVPKGAPQTGGGGLAAEVSSWG
jgi:hypothetical protein